MKLSVETKVGAAIAAGFIALTLGAVAQGNWEGQKGALIAAVLGFGGIAAASAGIAKFLFFLFLVMCVIFFVFGWRGRRVP